MYYEPEFVDRVAGLLAAFGVLTVVCLLFSVFMIVCGVIILRKVGYAGWEYIIPFYNMYCLYTAVGEQHPVLWVVLMCIPFANFVALFKMLKMYWLLPQCFGKSALWGWLCVFFTPIVFAILAFDKNAVYYGLPD